MNYQYRYELPAGHDPEAPDMLAERIAKVAGAVHEPGLGDTWVISCVDVSVALIIEALMHDAAWRGNAEKLQYSSRQYLGRCKCKPGCDAVSEGPLEWNDMEER